MSLTNDDLKNIKSLIKITIDEDETLVRKDDLKHLPTKNEFYDQMDEIMGELKAIREEQTVQSFRLTNHEDRVGVIEKKLQIKPQTV